MITHPLKSRKQGQHCTKEPRLASHRQLPCLTATSEPCDPDQVTFPLFPRGEIRAGHTIHLTLGCYREQALDFIVLAEFSTTKKEGWERWAIGTKQFLSSRSHTNEFCSFALFQLGFDKLRNLEKFEKFLLTQFCIVCILMIHVILILNLCMKLEV